MSKIHEDRIINVNQNEVAKNADYVLYWMQQSGRVTNNYALAHAQDQARELDLPLLVCFCFTPDYPGAQYRHFRFVLEGLKDVHSILAEKNISFVLKAGDPTEIVPELAERAAYLVFDHSVIAPPTKWRKKISDSVSIPICEVVTDVIVPLKQVSEKQEYAARTIRPKIMDQLDDYLQKVRISSYDKLANIDNINSDIDLSRDVDSILSDYSISSEVEQYSPLFTGGEKAAKRQLSNFVDNRLKNYRSGEDITAETVDSGLSPYLQYGHISPVDIVESVRASNSGSKEQVDDFIEEVIVRRELAWNFCAYAEEYDSLKDIPEWAQQTLEEHKKDDRDEIYTAEELELAKTDDKLWNACMKQMRDQGFLHNQLRMFWGKQILSWTNTPEYAHKVALDLNNRFFLDGFSPNSYTNIAWLFGLHDRAWQERPVYGKVRVQTKKGVVKKIAEDSFSKRA